MTPLQPHRRPMKYLAVAFIFMITTYHYLYRGQDIRSRSSPCDDAGNSTLGFQKIVVLSSGPTWRTRGLEAAASLTGIDLSIPIQPPITDETIDDFQKTSPSHPYVRGRGEAKNWLSFLDIIKFIIGSDLETALIIEDDVDWDSSIKTSTRLLSSAVRNFTWVGDEDPTPYGHSWDLFWIGHCAEPTRNDTRKVVYADPSAPNPEKYISPPWFPWSKNYMAGLTPGTRAIQRSQHTDCSFAIALSRRGAVKVLKYASKGEETQFDTRIKNGCMQKKLSCLSVTPELMHHYVPLAEFGHVSVVADANESGSKAEEEEFEYVMGNTPNIGRSARCEALFEKRCPGAGQ